MRHICKKQLQLDIDDIRLYMSAVVRDLNLLQEMVNKISNFVEMQQPEEYPE